ncbi:MAG: hypothetical protein EOO89_04310 [Pedobacter sp.]|nr:MAG: hypothetical protein EOO89_04310 [Pedobacter sp.]
MPEILLFIVITGLLLSPQIIAGMMAKNMGYNFWKWFGLSFLLPVISIFILANKKDKSSSKGYRLADHVSEGISKPQD